MPSYGGKMDICASTTNGKSDDCRHWGKRGSGIDSSVAVVSTCYRAPGQPWTRVDQVMGLARISPGCYCEWGMPDGTISGGVYLMITRKVTTIVTQLAPLSLRHLSGGEDESQYFFSM